MKRILLLRILITITLVWCAALPFVWARNIAAFLNAGYFEGVRLYAPEIASGLIAVPFLLGAWTLRAWSVMGLFTVAVLTPVLHYFIGSPSYGAWVISASLLGAIGWQVHLMRRENRS